MSSLPNVTGQEAIAAFGQLGFVPKRTSGSHVILSKPGHRFILSVPVHGKESLKPGTLRSLIRASGFTIEQFTENL